MKKFDVKYKIIIVLTVVAVLLLSMNIVLRKERPLTLFESTIKDSILFVTNIIKAPIDYFKYKIEENRKMDGILDKYKELQAKINYIESLETKIKTYEKEIDSLKQLLDLNSTLTEYSYINASIVNRNIGYWYNDITINKGKKDDVLINQAVINEKGLVGRIINTSNFNSTVKLLTADDTRNKLSILILSSKNYYGLLSKYDNKKKVFIIEGISSSSDINIGDKVITSGLSNNYPKGLLIGYVKNLTTDSYDLGYIVEVKPSVDYDDIEFVTIVKRKDNE